jgi:hypothetical protein
MGLAQIGLFAWQFVLAILPASAWLIICHSIPGLRRRVGFAYCVAASLVLLSFYYIYNHYGLTPAGLLAASIAGIILSLRWRNALKHRSLEINTIISYDDRDRM